MAIIFVFISVSSPFIGRHPAGFTPGGSRRKGDNLSRAGVLVGGASVPASRSPAAGVRVLHSHLLAQLVGQPPRDLEGHARCDGSGPCLPRRQSVLLWPIRSMKTCLKLIVAVWPLVGVLHAQNCPPNLPTISSFSPASGTPGTHVHIFGRDL